MPTIPVPVGVAACLLEPHQNPHKSIRTQRSRRSPAPQNVRPASTQRIQPPRVTRILHRTRAQASEWAQTPRGLSAFPRRLSVAQTKPRYDKPRPARRNVIGAGTTPGQAGNLRYDKPLAINYVLGRDVGYNRYLQCLLSVSVPHGSPVLKRCHYYDYGALGVCQAPRPNPPDSPLRRPDQASAPIVTRSISPGRQRPIPISAADAR